MYIYQSHMGGLYTSDDELDYEQTDCETCGDSDWLIGYMLKLEKKHGIYWKMIRV